LTKVKKRSVLNPFKKRGEHSAEKLFSPDWSPGWQSEGGLTRNSEEERMQVRPKGKETRKNGGFRTHAEALRFEEWNYLQDLAEERREDDALLAAYDWDWDSDENYTPPRHPSPNGHNLGYRRLGEIVFRP